MIYLYGSENFTSEEFASQPTVHFDARIMPKDLISITVSTSDPDAAIPYNLTATASTASNYSPASQPIQPKYQVDNNGQINFPTLGLISVKGMTIREAEDFIEEKLGKFVKDKLTVSVQFLDFTFSALGDVGNQGTFTMPTEKINILKALSMIGGVSTSGKLDNVKIFREDENGKKQIIVINLNDKNLLFSQNYYVQHNDVIYVESKKVKYQSANIQDLSIYTYGFTLLLTVYNLVMNFMK